MACLIPAMICLGLLGIYLISPEFYLGSVLEGKTRERGFVEVATFIAALAGGVLLLGVAWRFHERGIGIAKQPAVIFLLCIGFASLFFAGEEIDWGQRWIGWKSPEFFDTSATNLHNNLGRFGISVQSLGSVFLLVVFFVLPVYFTIARTKVKRCKAIGQILPDSLAISFVATASILRATKVIYRAVNTEATLNTSFFYMDYLEQINEQHEMLIAMGFLAYGVQIHRSSESRFHHPPR
jgi:hypothetical protein